MSIMYIKWRLKDLQHALGGEMVLVSAGGADGFFSEEGDKRVLVSSEGFTSVSSPSEVITSAGLDGGWGGGDCRGV